MKSILILTSAGDVHAYAVAEALRSKGGRVTLWHTSDYPSWSRETIRFSRDVESIVLRSPGVSLESPPDVVWNRRPSYYVDPSHVDPRDLAFAEASCHAARRSMFEFVAPSGFWVNDADASLRAKHKPLQHREAVKAGFATPDTLYTNDPEEIRNFIRANGGRVIFKPYAGQPWANNEKVFVPYSVLVGLDDMVDDRLLQAAPGIFQAYVPKAYELRVTAMGERLFAVKIRSQETARAIVDWRLGTAEVGMERTELPPVVARRCLDVMRALRLVFGCFDLIVRPDGTHVFLEVNQMGQFLFLEEPTGIPLLDAFAEFLLQGKCDFEWRETHPSLSYPDLARDFSEAWEREARAHVVRPPDIWDDSAATNALRRAPELV